MFVVSFANFKSRDPSSGNLMPGARVRVRAQASHENITVLSHLKTIFRLARPAFFRFRCYKKYKNEITVL